MKTFATSILSVLLMAVSISFTAANSKNVEIPKYSTTVKLDISASDEIQNQVYSYVGRELRALGDVEIVKDNSQWIIQIVAIQQRSKDGRVAGLGISSVILKPCLADRFLVVITLPKIKEILDKREYEILRLMLSSSYGVNSHKLQSGSAGDLESICKDVVADFDAEWLKKEREHHQELMNLLRQSLSEKGPINNKPKDD